MIESLTKDGRDRSLDYKRSKIHVPPNEGKIRNEIKPENDEIIIKKTSCSVFNSTNIDYILRNLGIKHLIIVGLMTNQCIEGLVRDASDLSYSVTILHDACLAKSPLFHEIGLTNISSFANIIDTQEFIDTMQINEAVEPLLHKYKSFPSEESIRKAKLDYIKVTNESKDNNNNEEIDDDLIDKNARESRQFIERSPSISPDKIIRIAQYRCGIDALYGSNCLPMFTEMFSKKFLPELDRTFQIDDYDIVAYNYPPRDKIDLYDVFLFTGSLSSAYEDEPWILNLMDQIRELHKRKKKLIGFCFGHQIITRALGGNVIRNPKGFHFGTRTFARCLTNQNCNHNKENDDTNQEKRNSINIINDVSSFEGRDLPFPNEFSLIYFNNDIVETLPPQGISIGGSSHFNCHGVVLGTNVLTWQGHPEMSTPFGLEVAKLCLLRSLHLKRINEEEYNWGIEILDHSIADAQKVARLTIQFIIHHDPWRIEN